MRIRSWSIKVREFCVWRWNESACVQITVALTSISQQKMLQACIPYLVCGASKPQLPHPLNKQTTSHPLNKRKKSVSSRLRENGIHNKTSEFTMKVRVWIWKHLILKSLMLFRANSATRFLEFNMPLIKSLRAGLPASNCFLDKEELQPICSLVNSTTKRSLSVKIFSLLQLLLWKAHQSFLMCFWLKTSVWIWNSFWNGFRSSL